MSIKKTILVIDDDADIIKLLRMQLEGSGRYAVLTSTDGRAAVELAKAQRPDLVLCDIDMPGMSGGDVAKALADDPGTAAMPLLYLSSLISDAECRRGARSGGRPIVSKESSRDILFKKIGEILGEA